MIPPTSGSSGHRGIFADLRTLGQRINARMLQAERVAHDCGLGELQFAYLVLPGRTPDGQPAPGLKFGQLLVMALLAALRLFGFTPAGITQPAPSAPGRCAPRNRRRHVQHAPDRLRPPTPRARRPDHPCQWESLLHAPAAWLTGDPVLDQTLRPRSVAGLPGPLSAHRVAGLTTAPHGSHPADVATDRLLQEAQLVAEKLRRVHAEHAPTRQLVPPELPTKLA
jgi:hypothetical protein